MNAGISRDCLKSLLMISRPVFGVRELATKTVAAINSAPRGGNKQHAPLVLLQQAGGFNDAQRRISFCKGVTDKTHIRLTFL